MISSTVKFSILNGFEDSTIAPDVWNKLLHQGPSDVVFLTWHWQKIWWEVFGRGKLLIALAERDGKLLAIAPLFADEGMVFFIGSGGSDYLDFIGDVSDTDTFEGLLLQAIEHVPNFLGFRFYHVLESSLTSKKLTEAAKRQGWYCCDEGKLVSPMLELNDFPEKALQSTRKKSLLRHEAYFKRNGGITIEHLNRSEDILQHLDMFFDQHIARWESTPYPSLFLDPAQRLFYRRLSEIASETGWIRFTRVVWQNRSISFHFGFNYHGRFFWYKPSFDIELSRRSPGEVLLRQLLLQAQEEKAEVFDFGLGEEAFKNRFATNTRLVRSWGLYPKSVLQ